MSSRPPIIAHHLIFTGYGHWLPNDPRGSGSTWVREPKLAELGDVHFGRKAQQPPRDELRAFLSEAQGRLTHQPIWFDRAKRQAIADGFAQAAAEHQYTIWACAILSNHAHVGVRRHRNDAAAIWDVLAMYSAKSLRENCNIAVAHPVWSFRPYKKFLRTPDDVRRTIRYIQGNPDKEKLPPQTYEFVHRYDGWPHKKNPR